ncbi:MgtC/SapB family protein [Thermobifida halotolerans]|uniref:MgtC/SapB family protein n=1 Tax=Thermobifida halotolerans TaxID=483545 RepID=A0A399G9T0_9ACTN|nr:MgtC/SapB family protein [Thermobifida halotolerans]UOE20462.1 MgtC/SapB family protein [Thermobifida halotolerans]
MGVTMATNLTDFAAQSWPQALALFSALVLCSLIGLEREYHNKNAGLRTHTLVGVGSALFMLVGKYGFGDVLDEGLVMLDPSRVAGQIVSGIGFIGAGLIFVRRDVVRGLTTAAAVWVSCAVGMACGAGLWLLGAWGTAAYFLVVLGFLPLLRLVTRSRPADALLRVNYEDGRGVLRSVLALATAAGFSVHDVRAQRRTERDGAATVDLDLRLEGRADTGHLAAELSETDGVLRVRVLRPDGSE